MHAEFNINYILTARFIQDYLENAFSQLRSLGGLYSHPTPIEVIIELGFCWYRLTWKT